MKEKRSKKNSKPRANRKVEHQFVKNLKPRTKEEKNGFKSRAKKKRSQKNSKPRANREAEHQFVKNLKSRAKEEKNRFKSRAKEKKIKRTLNLMRTEGQNINL